MDKVSSDQILSRKVYRFITLFSVLPMANSRVGAAELQGWSCRTVGLEMQNSRVGAEELQGWSCRTLGLELQNSKVGAAGLRVGVAEL